MSCENCDKCYEASAPECPSSLILNCELIPTTDYFVMLTDKFGEQYTQAVTSDAEGKVSFKTSQLPAGMLNRHAGNFKIEVRKLNTDCTPETLKLCCDGAAQNFQCVLLSFFQSTLGSLPTEIGCYCDDYPETSTTFSPSENEQTAFTIAAVADTDLIEVFLNGELSDQFTWEGTMLTYNGTTPLATTDIIKIVKN